MNTDATCRWLAVKDVLRIYKISISQQAKLRKLKVLPYSKVLGLVRYDRFLIDKLFESSTVIK